MSSPSISGDAFAGKPAFRMPNFKYTGQAEVLMRVDVDMYIEVVIVGQPENGAYEWLIVNEIVGGFTVERHSDCGYGQKSIALRDGLIAFHGLEPLAEAAPDLFAALRRVIEGTEDTQAASDSALAQARAALAKATS